MTSNELVPVNRPLVTDEDIGAVTQALKDGWISGDAPEVAQFELEFAERHGCAHGIAVPNGTIAIDLLMSVLDLEPGDEVILPSFAIISCLSQILRAGARPIFVDACPETWNMDTKLVRGALSAKTKLILVVHTYGLPTEMTSLLEISEETGIPIVEDCAEAHGLLFNGESCGQFGIASTFSFYANKNVTTGEGGMVCTNSAELATQLRYFRNLTFNPEDRFVHQDLGWNYRLSAIQAALGRSQLRRLDETIHSRRDIARLYREALGDIEGVTFAPETTSYGKNDFWVVGILLDSTVFASSRVLRSQLQAKGVGTRPFFYPLHRQPAYKKSANYREFDLPVADRLYRQGLYLPNGLGSPREELEHAATTVQQVLEVARS